MKPFVEITMKPTLKLTLDTGFGESYTVMINLEEYVAREYSHIEPPILHSIPWTNHPGVPLQPFEEVANIIKRREFRKKLFTDQCANLGTILSERMEDAEGWHDASRIELAKESLREV